MKIPALIALLLVTLHYSYGQAVLSKPLSKASLKSITDFGAIANDGKDDTWAFIKAGKYFSNLWDINGVPLEKGKSNFDYSSYGAKLTIPSGKYLVGKLISVPPSGLNSTYGKIFGYPQATAPIDVPSGAAFRYGLEIIKLQNPLNNIDQFVIEGIGKYAPQIKYNDGLIVGYFNSEGKPLFFPKTNYDVKYVVQAGHFVYAINCRNIEIKNISVDGNNTSTEKGGNTYYDGGWDGALIQMGSCGAIFTNSKNITIENVSLNYMALDGIMFQDFYKDPVKFLNQSLSNLLLRSVKCNYNRRQGFSWVGGRNITAINCSFSHTGTTVSGPASGNPGAGVDIEPEEDDAGNRLWCMDGRFINCEMINNKGLALGNDYNNYSKNMIFDSCKFHDVESYAVWVKGKAYTFNNCKIWGGFVYGNEGLVQGEETIFNGCDFADEEINTKPGQYNKGYDLVGSWQAARRMQFNNCTFRTIHTDQKLCTIYTPTIEEKYFTVFSDCKFTVGEKSNGSSSFLGCKFSGRNLFLSNNLFRTETINLNAVVFTGSNSACNPAGFAVKGKFMLHPANSHGMGSTQFVVGRNNADLSATDGFINFDIQKDACLYGYWNQTIDIGKNSKFTNHAGGQIAILSGTFNNNGKIVFKEGSYNWFANPIKINTALTANPEFLIEKNAYTSLNNVWASVFKDFPKQGAAMSSLILSAETIIDGNNESIIAGNKSKAKYALPLDGKNEYIAFKKSAPKLKLNDYSTAKSFSIELFFKRYANTRNEVMLTQGGFNIFFKGNRLMYKLPGITTVFSTPILLPVNDSNVNSIVFLRGLDNFIKIYHNGQLLHTGSKMFPGSFKSSEEMYLGKNMQGKEYQNFRGEILQMRIWSKALNSEEICYNYSRSTPVDMSNIMAIWINSGLGIQSKMTIKTTSLEGEVIKK